MSTSDLSFRQSDRLIFLGILLFLLGLLVGMVVPFFANPRMGLSSHLEGIMNGIFLVVLGLIWPRINLSKNWITVAFWLAIYGTFVNWLGILIAAVFDAGANLSIAAEGKRGSDAAETLVNFCLISLTFAMFCVCLLILIGLWRGRHRPF